MNAPERHVLDASASTVAPVSTEICMPLTAFGLDRTLKPAATRSSTRRRLDHGLTAIVAHGVDTSTARVTEAMGGGDSGDLDQPPAKVADTIGMRARNAVRLARLLQLHPDPGPRKG
ncbi:hypothetical protein EGK76_14910 [Luteimonas sp. 100069]|nr:hypothetical protein EGK76_14910 [Luteimonas sp. 100069]